ncbi:hypothetical protein [Blastococcus sp. Marseille-P5729]|uniref:hypothetical protein n=1 Tax=Blastococcus sp. Marseille-P5729 TaxID=2086582 RepID=UPI00131CB5FF|nr:hypothetical protein [Blastococcus sp. Marseille-P5729]
MRELTGYMLEVSSEEMKQVVRNYFEITGGTTVKDYAAAAAVHRPLVVHRCARIGFRVGGSVGAGP